jgi:hypothetical protein
MIVLTTPTRSTRAVARMPSPPPTHRNQAAMRRRRLYRD